MKLSEFKGQEHITGPLRAMVIKGKPNKHIAIVGQDEMLALDIFLAFMRALNCPNQAKGDSCERCNECQNLYVAFGRKWLWYMVDDEAEYPKPNPHLITFSIKEREDYLHFYLRDSAVKSLDTGVVKLAVASYYVRTKEVLELCNAIAEQDSFDTFVAKYLDFFRAIIYTQNNIATPDIGDANMLGPISTMFSPYAIVACMKILWEALSRSNKTDDVTAISTLALLITHALHPFEYQQNNSFPLDKPIIVVERDNKSLTFEEMFALADE